MQPRSFFCDLLTPFIDRMMSSMSSSTSLGQLFEVFASPETKPPRPDSAPSVGGKVLDMETGISPEKLLQRLAFMGTRVISQHHHGTLEMPKQVAEEQTHFFLPNIVIEEIVVEVQSLPFRADREAGDHGNFVSPINMTMNRSLPDRSPGLGDMGKEEKSGLVGKHYVGAQPSGFFFIRGRCRRFHCSTAWSSHSIARRSGF